jgi:AraC-like DNA-binding protein
VILDEMAAHKRKSKSMLQNDAEKIRAIAKELGIEDYAEEFLREQGIAPSVSDAADEILRDLRETGTIGGSRAV